MKSIFISCLVLFTGIIAFNLDAGHGHSRRCHDCHHRPSRVSFNVGTTVVRPVAVPVTTYVPVQQTPIVVSQPCSYPVTYVEYEQPVIVQQPVVVVKQRPSPWSFFNFGFSFGN